MRKLGFAFALCLAAVGCKSNDAAQTPSTQSSTGESSGDDTSGNASTKNRSGKIELPQVKTPARADGSSEAPSDARRGRGPRDPARWEARQKERTAEMDADGDGKVSDTERAAARKLRMEERMTRMDTNGDGKLSKDEVQGGRFRRLDFDAADTNKDGSLSVDELEAASAKGMRNDRGRWSRRDGAGSSAAPPAQQPEEPATP